jgi:hypothetical protein
LLGIDGANRMIVAPRAQLGKQGLENWRGETEGDWLCRLAVMMRRKAFDAAETRSIIGW